MYHRHSDERLGNVVDLREEQAQLLRRQWMSQQLDGYVRVVGSFGLDGCFYAVEYEKLDMVSP